MIKLIHGDCLDQLRLLPDCSVDSVVTDPPYGLSFMGKKWDYDVPGVEVWTECLRVLKSGGHLLAFAGTRTQHRMAVRIEDAGFEIRDMIAWVYGSGFPKSHDVSKAIDKAAGAERNVVGFDMTCRLSANKNLNDDGWSKIGQQGAPITAPATDAAKQWDGWGTALKPALEPITVARKPLIGTVAENVLAHGTGGLNVDGCRVSGEGWGTRTNSPETKQVYGDYAYIKTQAHDLGRWPANFIHDGSEEVVGLFPHTKAGVAIRSRSGGKTCHSNQEKPPMADMGYADGGSAARFFYCAKASKSDRDEGCEGLEERQRDESRKEGNVGGDNPRNRGVNLRTNHHPTVKPTDLMRYLCRLVTPPGGTVLDPFMGSGSTGKAAVLEGFSFIGIEREAEYIAIAEARMPKTYTPDIFSHAL